MSVPLRRVVLVDDHAIFRAGLRAGLDRTVEVVGEAGTVEAAVPLIRSLDPDVVLLDVEMPGGGGVVAARGIRERAPRSAIVAISADESRQGVLDMLDAGAMTYVRKGVAHEELVKRLHAAIAAHRRLVE